VRNYQARNNLKNMEKGDLVLFYHSNEGLEVVGISKVSRENYQDPTTSDERWVAVDIEPVETLKKPVSLAEIKKESKLKDIALIKQSRLSVIPITKKEFDTIIEKSR